MSELTYQEALHAKKLLYDRSLYHYTKYCLGYKDMVSHVHGPICDALQAPTRRKMIVVPRSCFKSSCATIGYPMWRLNHNPNLRILIDSELYSNSKNFLREIKGHYERNAELIRHYGMWVGPLWNEDEIIVSKRDIVKKEPTIVCSGIGAGKTSQHYDIIIADDLSSYKNVHTKELAQKTIDHYRLYTSLLEPDGTLVIIGTRYSQMDIIGFVLENELGISDGDVKKLKELYCEQGK